ncbi:unnamed protein product [Toxocara canis]|uniref:Bromo domain-containing protein n=1 Tax=Toxocara canis TaxID=6265 RepID=A0A183UEU4_TOXCA|nr:unnamed protein product [Toxocara canis]
MKSLLQCGTTVFLLWHVDILQQMTAMLYCAWNLILLMSNSAIHHDTIFKCNSAPMECASSTRSSPIENETIASANHNNDLTHKQNNHRAASTNNIWESPPQKAVKGVVQPRVLPPLGKPTRRTNQLDFLADNVLKALMRHEDAWPFLNPVDALKLNIPDYHSVVKRPMDLNTIAKRLDNAYYFSADECMKDFETIFANCYKYNRKGNDVWMMCKNIEAEYRERTRLLPIPEVELARSMAKRRFIEDSRRSVMKKRPHKRDDLPTQSAKMMQSSVSNVQKETETIVSLTSEVPNGGALIVDSANVGSCTHSSPPTRDASPPTSTDTLFQECEAAPFRTLAQACPLESAEKDSADNTNATKEAAERKIVPLDRSEILRALDEDRELNLIQKTVELEIIRVQEKIITLKGYEQDIAALQLRRKEARAEHKPGPALDMSNVPMLQSLVSVPLFVQPPRDAALGSLPPRAVSPARPTETFAVASKSLKRRLSIDGAVMNDLTPQVETPTDMKAPPSTPCEISIQQEAVPAVVLDELMRGNAGKNDAECASVTNLIQRGQTAVNNEAVVADVIERQHTIRCQTTDATRFPKKRSRQSKSEKCKRRQAESTKLSSKSRYGSDDDREVVIMTHEDKRRLSLDINRLPQDKLNTVVSIIKSHEVLSKCDDDEVEFDIETLKPSTLRHLEAFVSCCLKKKPRKPYTPKSQEDVDNRKRELVEKIKGLGGTVSAEYPRRVLGDADHMANDGSALLSESSSSEDSSSGSSSS